MFRYFAQEKLAEFDESLNKNKPHPDYPIFKCRTEQLAKAVEDANNSTLTQFAAPYQEEMANTLPTLLDCHWQQ